MSRYIDADAIRYHDMSDGQGMWYVWRDEIHDMPTADVVPMDFHNKVLEIEIKKQENLVEVVRCKDCKHYKIDHPRANGYHCCYRMHSIFPMKPDDFCSYGERREDE